MEYLPKRKGGFFLEIPVQNHSFANETACFGPPSARTAAGKTVENLVRMTFHENEESSRNFSTDHRINPVLR